MYKNLYTVKNHLWFLWLENAPCSYILYFRAITSAACKRGRRFSHRLKTKAIPSTYRSGGDFLTSLYSKIYFAIPMYCIYSEGKGCCLSLLLIGTYRRGGHFLASVYALRLIFQKLLFIILL